MVSNSCLECEVLSDAICPFNMKFNNNGVDHHVDVTNRNGHRCEKTGEKQIELSFSNRHEKIAF
jgi:hypothetical protein